ncbi:MAG: Asp-tRNA(Asn)/Glu-tRNA(Gln) amidotransferase subunit GatB [Anaerolineae bacterium]|nr:Asp-tRNA(Asn)/Glu-tRNA(Gln) amidotransferase subunit GatB [Anaerolineae bacterium]
MVEYEGVIGLEIHAELLTKSKMFCGCEVVDSTTAPPNTHTCPVCTAMPGVLPVVNRQAVEFGIMVGLALNCEIAPFNIFARKSYFYPDLPKGYQISQYEYPLALNGWVEIEANGGVRRIGIRRAHLEEDTGKSTHMGGYSLLDFNRAGVPLLEIVTEPDLHTAEEAEAFARKLRSILVYLGVNSGDMSKGVLRMEPNVSVRPKGSAELRTRTEVKNLNSIRAVRLAIDYEIERQVEVWESGGRVEQVNMGWDEARGKTVVQRSKESADDYRYFPEPDLPPLVIERAWVDAARAKLPELPDAKRARFMSQMGLNAYDAGVLVADRAVADFFEQTTGAGMEPKAAANWITGEVFRLMNKAGVEREDIGKIALTPAALAKLAGLVEKGAINANTARDVLGVLFDEGGDPEAIVKARGWGQVSDTAALAEAVDKVLAANPDAVRDYLGGKETIAKWLMGQVMREMRGKGNPQIALELLSARLEALKNGRF